MKIKSLLSFTFFILASQLSGCATVYSSADVEGRIIDKATGEPVAGAVVVGIWQVESQGFEHYYGPVIHVTESLTDDKGLYHLKGFDYQWVTGGWSLVYKDPFIHILAEGYKPTGRDSYDYPDKSNMGIRRISPLNGKDVEIERMEITDPITAFEWRDSLLQLKDAIGDCEILKFPGIMGGFTKVEPSYSLTFEQAYGRRKELIKRHIRCRQKEEK